MPSSATAQILRRHAAAFTVSFVSFTALLLFNTAMRRLTADQVPLSRMGEVLLLSVSHISALTIPMAVLAAVLWVFTRLGAEGVLAAARRERHGVRRLVVPVLGAAAAVGVLTLVFNAEILPRTNHRLKVVLADGGDDYKSDREMTLFELRTAARSAREEGNPEALRRAAMYEVELHKKFALPAACMVFVLVGAALALRFPHGGVELVFCAVFGVFGVCYVFLTAGESLADRLVVSPSAAMWTGNAMLLAVAALLFTAPSFSMNDVVAAAGAEGITVEAPAPAHENVLLARVGSSPFAPGALDRLFFRPSEFFAAGHAFNRSANILSMILVIGIARAADSLRDDIFIAQFDESTLAGSSRRLESWGTFWRFIIPAGALWGGWVWCIGGWWYRVRLRWCGAHDVSARSARLVYAYVSLIAALPALLVLLVDTVVHENFAVAFGTATPWSLVPVITLFWAYVVSYRSVTGLFAVERSSALLWFLALPTIVSVSVMAIVRILLARFAP
jgi:lipopolysaccharide export LptBFGC system permease protein LptF